jgi:surface protein
MNCVYIILKVEINNKEIGKDIIYLNQNNEYNFYKNFEINDIIVIVDDKISDVKYRKISEYKYDENSKNCEIAQEIYYNLKTPHYFFLNFSTKGIHSIKIIFKKILTSYKKLFSNCKNLIEIDFSHFQCSNYVDSFEQMFYNCNNLTSLDVSHFNTKNSTSFESMFEGCTKLQNIDLSNFNSSKCENISKMFMNCKNITEVDMLNLNLNNFRNTGFLFWRKKFIDRLFYGCKNLRMTKLNTNFNEEIVNNTNIFEGIPESGNFIYRKKIKEICFLGNYHNGKVYRYKNNFYNN